jgi:lipoprotein-anchoring transpeptidase ErfK/SrfK
MQARQNGESSTAATKRRGKAAAVAGDRVENRKSSEERIAVGWKLDGEQRSWLLNLFSSAYPDVIADHVTLSSGPDKKRPPKDTSAEIVGQVDDGAGVQAFVVRIDGTTDRPDGSTYHITWSIDRSKGRKARDSNDVIRTLGWQELEQPMPITLKGASWPTEEP